MASHTEWILPVVLVVGEDVVLPSVLVWGWTRWARRIEPRTVFSMLSLAGFTLATASALLAISSVAYAHAIGGFPFYDPLLL